MKIAGIDGGVLAIHLLGRDDPAAFKEGAGWHHAIIVMHPDRPRQVVGAGRADEVSELAKDAAGRKDLLDGSVVEEFALEAGAAGFCLALQNEARVKRGANGDALRDDRPLPGRMGPERLEVRRVATFAGDEPENAGQQGEQRERDQPLTGLLVGCVISAPRW